MKQAIVKKEYSLLIKQKEMLIEQLEKTPIIQSCCEKLRIPRSTFYRWKNEDFEFSEKIDGALIRGRTLINELAESKVINAISNGEMVACFFWLKHNSRQYIIAQKEIAHEEPGHFRVTIINSETREMKEKPKVTFAKIKNTR